MKIDQVDAESRVLHVARLKSGVTDDTALTRATDIGGVEILAPGSSS